MKTPEYSSESGHNLEDCENEIAEILADAMYEHIKKSPQKPDQKVKDKEHESQIKQCPGR